MKEAGEIEIGSEQIALLTHELTLSVEPNLSVRVRIRDVNGKLLADIATTAIRALHIAALFKHAAERADPSIVVRQLEAAK
jgi:hypothetical protein